MQLTKTRKKKILKGIITIILFLSNSYLKIIPILLFKIDVNNYTAKDLAIVNTSAEVLYIILLVILYHKELKIEFKDFKKNFKTDFDIALKYWICGLGIMYITNIIISIITKMPSSSNETAVQSLITSAPYLMLITAGILAPIAEELTFRKGIAMLIKNKWIYCIVSGFIFGLLHVIGYSGLEYLYLIPYGSLGFFFAIIYSKTNNIYPSICMHALHNTILVLLSIIAL